MSEIYPKSYDRYKDDASKEKRKIYLRNYSRTYMRNYKIRHPEKFIRTETHHGYTGEYYNRIRRKAMEKIGGFKCSNCGCTSEKILEINHTNGGGAKEYKQKGSKTVYRDIIKNRVDLTKYNVLCKVCNSLHYTETILGVKGHTVIWKPN